MTLREHGELVRAAWTAFRDAVFEALRIAKLVYRLEDILRKIK